MRDALPDDARVVKDLGDGLMLWFPEPVSALGSCLALAERFEEEAATDVPLWVRVGMHWGCPARRGADLVGHDVNLAARIVDVAGPGEVLVSEPVRELVDGRPRPAHPRVVEHRVEPAEALDRGSDPGGGAVRLSGRRRQQDARLDGGQ